MESTEMSSGDRLRIDQRRPRQRSRVTNGKSYFVEADQRGPWARRWADVLAEIIFDIRSSHEAGLSEGQRQLARRAATICIQCERMEGEAASGEDIDIEQYGRLTDRLGRAFQRLGLKRQARTLAPDLDTYLASLPKDESYTNRQANAGVEDHATEDHAEPCAD